MRQTALVLLTGGGPSSWDLIRQACQLAQCDVVRATSAAEAVKAAVRDRFELLLLDLNQPFHKGWSIAESVMAANPAAGVIVLTEDGAAYDHAATGGACAVVQKPCSLTALVRTIEVLLERSSRRAEETAAADSGLSAAVAASAEFRDSLDRRYSAVYDSATAYRHWGINE